MRTFIKNIALRLNMTRAENTPFLCNAELNRIMDEEETNNLLTGSGTKDEIRAATHRALDEPFAGMHHGGNASRVSMAVAHPDEQMRFGGDDKTLDELELEALHVEALHEDKVRHLMANPRNPELGRALAPRQVIITPVPEGDGVVQDFIADQQELRREERLRILNKVLDGNTKIIGTPNDEPIRIDLTEHMLDLPEEPTGEGLKFIKQIHNEFFATAWNWHRESKAHGKTNYGKHHRFFFLVGERVHNDDWTEISKLETHGFTVGYDKTLDRVTVVVNDVSVWVDMKGVVAELEKAKAPDWNRLTGLK
jgi:hypothetical protein